MNKKIICTLIVLFACAAIVEAQQSLRKKNSKRFAAGIIGGSTFSQLDGDNYTGYDHRSIFGGLKVSAFLNDKLSFDVNLLFIQKGASIENEEIEFRASYPKNRFIHLSYAEVPLLLTLKPNSYNSKLYFEGGVTISKLLNTEIKENVRDFTDVSFESISSDFSTKDIALIAGIGSYLTQHLSIGMRFSYGLNKIYVNPNPIYRESLLDIVPKQVFFLRNYYIALNVGYTIF